MSHGKAVHQDCVMSGIFAGCFIFLSLTTEFKSIGITAIWEMLQVFSSQTREFAVHACSSRMIGQVKLGRTIIISHTEKVHGWHTVLRITLKRIPTIVRVIPCSATNIGIACKGTSTLLIRKAIGITAVCLIIKVIMRIAVYHQIMTAFTQLHARVTAPIDIESLQTAIGGIL